jgi:hypothetical protein
VLKYLQFLGPLIVCVISIIIMNVGKYYVSEGKWLRAPALPAASAAAAAAAG